MSLFFGVDPGTQITGYGVIRKKGSRFETIDFGCIRTPSALPLPERYKIIFESLEELIKKFSPDALAVETQFVSKNPQSAMKVGMARGMALLAAARASVPVFEYSPTKVKIAVVGKGNASKYQVQKMMQQLLELPQPPTPEDAADALAIALCHANQWRGL